MVFLFSFFVLVSGVVATFFIVLMFLERCNCSFIFLGLGVMGGLDLLGGVGFIGGVLLLDVFVVLFGLVCGVVFGFVGGRVELFFMIFGGCCGGGFLVSGFDGGVLIGFLFFFLYFRMVRYVIVIMISLRICYFFFILIW